MRFAGSGSSNKRCPGKITSGLLKKEQKKLEKMILESFSRGDTNLGNNEDILRQSIKVDRLIVRTMIKKGNKCSDGVAEK